MDTLLFNNSIKEVLLKVFLGLIAFLTTFEHLLHWNALKNTKLLRDFIFVSTKQLRKLQVQVNEQSQWWRHYGVIWQNKN